MICALSIRSFLLIDRLDIEACDGFTALTGETGAGKSIILDALGLALGGQASRKFVRKGADQAVVLAELSLPPDHAAWPVLEEQGISASPFETLTLKRVIPANGPARAFINDQPASAGLLETVGETVVEIHGQHSASGLMRPARHRDMLDLYAGNEPLLKACAEAWTAYQERRAIREALEADLEEVSRQHAWLTETREELAALGAREGEFETLSAERNILMQSEKIAESLGEALQAFEGGDIEAALSRASRATERVLRIDGLEGHDGPLARAARTAAARARAEAAMAAAEAAAELS